MYLSTQAVRALHDRVRPHATTQDCLVLIFILRDWEGDVLHVTEGAAQVEADPKDMVAGVEVMRQRIQGDSVPVMCPLMIVIGRRSEDKGATC